MKKTRVRPHVRRAPRRKRRAKPKVTGFHLFRTPQEKAAQQRQHMKEGQQRLKEDLLREKIDKAEAEDRLYQAEGRGSGKNRVGKLI
jgi:hypothetical protein